jgi:hypothetical protein
MGGGGLRRWLSAESDGVGLRRVMGCRSGLVCSVVG